MRKTHLTRRNPLRTALQPDLFSTEDTYQTIDWRQASVEGLRQAAVQGLLTAEEYEEMDEVAGNEDLLQDLPYLLQDVLTPEFLEELRDQDTLGYERRVKPFMDYFRDNAEWQTEYETTEGGSAEHITDAFQSDLEYNVDDYVAQAFEQIKEEDPELAEKVSEDVLKEILEDPEMYDLNTEGGDPLWTYALHEIRDTPEGWYYNETLKELLGQMTEADFDRAIREMENNEPYFSFSFSSYERRRGPELFTKEDMESSFEVRWSTDVVVGAHFRWEEIVAALRERVDYSALAETDVLDIVYRYSGTNDSVGGASAKGMFVAALKPHQLRAESAAGGICVGNRKYHYYDALKAGRIRIYSIRTEVGKFKFTIEESVGNTSIVQVKGKANRLPGFEPGKTELSKADEVRLVTEFLLHLGYTPEEIEYVSDVRPGVLALKQAGIDPFIPPVRKARAPRPNFQTSHEVRRLAREAYSHPWGGHWGI